MRIAILLFDKFTALDAVGPYEVLSRIHDAQLHFVAEQPGPIVTDTRALTLMADMSFEDMPDPDIIVVPGGPEAAEQANSPGLIQWLKQAHISSKVTTSVCTGSLILGAAGILENLRATTHWTDLERLKEHGAIPSKERVIQQGKIWTAAGVSAGIDMALRVVADLYGERVAQAIQLGIEYAPEPPFNSGSPDTAPAELVAAVRASLIPPT